MTRDIVLFVVLFVGLFALLVYLRRQDSKRLRQKTLEAASPQLRSEVEQERAINLEKRNKFEEALKKANGGK